MSKSFSDREKRIKEKTTFPNIEKKFCCVIWVRFQRKFWVFARFWWKTILGSSKEQIAKVALNLIGPQNLSNPFGIISLQILGIFLRFWNFKIFLIFSSSAFKGEEGLKFVNTQWLEQIKIYKAMGKRLIEKSFDWNSAVVGHFTHVFIFLGLIPLLP